jgi:hypothetical protein
MADISTELARILSAIYGEDVRGSIHDAIEKINDVSEKVIDAGTAVTSASSSSTGYYTDSLYVNTDTNDLWKCTGTDTWALIGNLEGAQGETGNGIESIELTSTSGLVDTYTITYTDGSTSSFTIHNGAVPTITINATADALSSDTPTVTVTRTGTTDAPIFSMAFSGLKGQQGVQGIQGETGETGNGIASIAKTSTSGKVDTYTITMTDGSTATFTVTNGEDGHGAGDMLQSAYDPDLDVYNAGGIVDYVSAHAALYSAGANINISSGHVISVTGLATVATSGSYNDLSNKPTIPTITDTYSATSSNGMSGKAVAQAIGGLDKSDSAVSGKYVSAVSETDGIITVSRASLPTIPTVNNGQLTIQQNGTNKATFTANQSGSATANIITDTWTSTATVSSSGTVSFSGLNDSYGYKIYYTLPSGDSAYTFSKVTKSGSGTSVTLTYTTDAPSGTVCKLRILK